jgi:hypothetical protein
MQMRAQHSAPLLIQVRQDPIRPTHTPDSSCICLQRLPANVWDVKGLPVADDDVTRAVFVCKVPDEVPLASDIIVHRTFHLLKASCLKKMIDTLDSCLCHDSWPNPSAKRTMPLGMVPRPLYGRQTYATLNE